MVSARPAALLDRDGTIIFERHYLSDPAQVELLPGAAQGLRELHLLGFKLVVVSNQSGLSRGYFDRARLHAIHGRLRELLADEDVTLDGIYVCPHLPDEGCACRKPQPGLVLRAVDELELDVGSSIVIGDKRCDIELGHAVGATTFLVLTGYGNETASGGLARPHFVVSDLSQVAAHC
jgi:D-glycero-D-manno-heptose 1,7-bisphosphate phosphatase